MPLREDLLTPFPGNNPSGENLRYNPIYDKIKEARRKEEVIAQGDWGRPLKEADYRLVIKLASEALATKSKDLQIAAWLSEALVYQEGMRGLNDGLKLLRGLVDNFWETVYPEAEDGDLELRVAPLQWVGDYRDLQLAVRHISLTNSGFDFLKYKESCTVGYESDTGDNHNKVESRSQAIAEGKLTAEEFDQDFASTPKAHFQQLIENSDQALEALQALNAIADEKFADVAPSFHNLRTTIEDVQHVAKMLLARKLETDPDPVAESETFEEAPSDELATETSAPGGETSAGKAGTAVRKALSAEPADANDAIARVITASRYLRSQDPQNPVPYLILRSLRWGELRAQAEIQPELLEAPPTEIRQQIKKASLEGDWTQVLEIAERAMAMPCGRGWLDLQRYVVRACTELGIERVASAISSEVKRLLEHFPQLPQMTLMDDTPTANAETQTWLKGLAASNGQNQAALTDSPLDIEDTEESGQPIEIDPYQLALEAVRSHNPEEGMRILTREIAHERSGRGRFLRRLQLAQVCIASNREAIAHAILDELAREIESRKLEDWEAAETIAHALGLLFRCMGSNNDGSRQKVYAQICRLDPVQAAQLTL